MSPTELRCPHCQAAVQRPVGEAPATLWCGHCGRQFQPPLPVARPPVRAARRAAPPPSHEPEPPSPRPRTPTHKESAPPASKGKVLLLIVGFSVSFLIVAAGLGVAAYFVYDRYVIRQNTDSGPITPSTLEAEHLAADTGSTPGPVVKDVLPSTISIRATNADGTWQWSGFFDGKPGEVLTTAVPHGDTRFVLGRDPAQLEVTLSGPVARKYQAQVVGVDADANLALLRIAEAALPKPVELQERTLGHGALVYVCGAKGTPAEVTARRGAALGIGWRETYTYVVLSGVVPNGPYPREFSGGPVTTAGGVVIGIFETTNDGKRLVAISGATVLKFLTAQHQSGGTIGLGKFARPNPGSRSKATAR